MASEKLAALPRSADEIVLCADTTVALGRRILGKPRDAGQAATFLLALSGRRHRVITAIAVAAGEYKGYFPIRHENGHNLDPKFTMRWLKKQMSVPEMNVIIHPAS